MFNDDGLTSPHPAGPTGAPGAEEPVVASAVRPAVAVSSSQVAAIGDLLQRLDPALSLSERADGDDGTAPGLTEAQCIDLLRGLENLKSVAAGVPAAKRGKGLAGEVALARRVSPHRGGRHLGMARALRADMPHTLAALRRGDLSEWRATLLVRESICLSGPQRRDLDGELWAEPERLTSMGDRQLVAEAKRVAYRLDPHSVARRAAKAERERCVSIRPAPDTMAYLTALLPVSQAVAAHAALSAAAGSARAAGDDRSRGQVMADTLVARVTGTDAAVPSPVQVQLVMTDQTLAGGDEPGYVPEHGTVPAGWARDLLRRALADEGGCGAWVRRLFTDRAGHLVAMESRARHAPPGLAHYVATRDAGRCRTPYCDAPVRHIDHIVDHSAGGATEEENLEGCCEACNYAKTAPGWSASPAGRDDPSRSTARAGPLIETRTPTGHTYSSPTPRLPRAG